VTLEKHCALGRKRVENSKRKIPYDRSDRQRAETTKKVSMRRKISMKTLALYGLPGVGHWQEAETHRGTSRARRNYWSTIDIDEHGYDLQVFSWTQLQHQEEPFLRLQGLMKGDDVLVDG